MVQVQGGAFTMGSNEYDDEKPPHNVAVPSFKIGKYEVTQAQWRAVMGANPSHFKGCDQCPVENVSWNDVQDFIKTLNRLTGKRYRLPTEAEWEYAARGGRRTQGHKYAGSDDLSSVAWHSGNSNSKTHEVGGKKANELGLCDMSGNVWEWVQDVYANSYNGAPTDGSARTSGGSARVLRGGARYVPYDYYFRVSNRLNYVPSERYYAIGFRLAED